MGDEAERQTDNADVQNERVKQEDVKDAATCPRLLADEQVQHREHHAQDSDGYGDHWERPSLAGLRG